MSNRGGGAKEEGGGLLTPCSAIGLVTLLLHVGMLLVQVWLGWRRREAVAEAVAPGPPEAPLEALKKPRWWRRACNDIFIFRLFSKFSLILIHLH